jgi:hypothetical protein
VFQGSIGEWDFWVLRLEVLCGWECVGVIGCDIWGVWRQVLPCGWGVV